MEEKRGKGEGRERRREGGEGEGKEEGRKTDRHETVQASRSINLQGIEKTEAYVK